MKESIPLPNNQDIFSQFEELFWQVSREMSYKWNEIFDTQFPGSQSYILFTLKRKGKKRMPELAERFGIYDDAHVDYGGVCNRICRTVYDKNRKVQKHGSFWIKHYGHWYLTASFNFWRYTDLWDDCFSMYYWGGA